MIWTMFQFIAATVSGIFIPGTVSIPESTLIPPVEIIQTIDPIISVTSQKNPPPKYLIIPSIDVFAAIDPVSLTEKGAVGVPSEPATLGWFDKSPVPGEKGSAIIDGHRGWRNKTPAVFDHLHEIALGDIVIVIDSDGATIPFQVYDIKNYNPNESPEEVFLPNDDIFLNLITCNGEWDSAAGTATKRLVVFTKKVTLGE